MKFNYIITILLLISCTGQSQNWNNIYYLESEAEFMISYNQIDDAIGLYKEALGILA